MAFQRRSNWQPNRLPWSLECLEARLAPAAAAIVGPTTTPAFSVGAGPGGGPQVNVYFNNGSLLRSFSAYDPVFRGGVRVATADINGDGVRDIVTAPGPGGGPDIRVFNGVSGALFMEFLAYDPAFIGGVFVSAGDVNGDGRPDIITGAGAGGGPHVKAFSGTTGALLASIIAYDPTFTGGVSVAAGDTTGDGIAEIFTGPGVGGGPLVRVFNPANGVAIANFYAFDSNLRFGVNVAALPGNFGSSSIITSQGAGGTPEVRLFNTQYVQVDSFFAYDPNFLGGVNVGAAPASPFGMAAVLTGAGTGGGPHVKALVPNLIAPPTLQLSFLAFDPAFLGGVYVG